MNTAKLVVVAMVLWILSAWSFGQSPSTNPATRPAFPPGGMAVGGVYCSFEEFFKICEVTKDQQQKIAEIIARGERPGTDKEKVMRDAQMRLSEAYKAKDADAIAKSKEEFTKLNLDFSEHRNKVQADVLSALTAEQRDKWRQYPVLKAVKFSYRDVKFSDEQWDKIMEACEKLANDSTIKPYDIIYRLNPKIEAILTIEQKAKLLMASRYAMMNKVCQLTDEQARKIAQIEDDRAKALVVNQAEMLANVAETAKAMQDPNVAGNPDAVAALRKQWADGIELCAQTNKKYDDRVLDLLTDKQKAAWKEHQQKLAGQTKQPGGAPGTPTSKPGK